MTAVPGRVFARASVFGCTAGRWCDVDLDDPTVKALIEADLFAFTDTNGNQAPTGPLPNPRCCGGH